MKETEAMDQKRRNEARQRRYKKAVCSEINLETIRIFISETMDAASEVAYATQNEDVLLDAMDGDEEEAFEFRSAFGMLSADLERFYEDMQECWIPECFDDFFASICDDRDHMMGYDAYEGDYFGLEPGYETEIAIKEAQKRLTRLTKNEILEAAAQCFRVAFAFIGLRARFEDLQASLDILRAKNDGILEAVKQIEALYDRVEEKGFGEWDNTIEKEFDKMASNLPDECWIR